MSQAQSPETPMPDWHTAVIVDSPQSRAWVRQVQYDREGKVISSLFIDKKFVVFRLDGDPVSSETIYYDKDLKVLHREPTRVRS